MCSFKENDLLNIIQQIKKYRSGAPKIELPILTYVEPCCIASL